MEKVLQNRQSEGGSPSPSDRRPVHRVALLVSKPVVSVPQYLFTHSYENNRLVRRFVHRLVHRLAHILAMIYTYEQKLFGTCTAGSTQDGA